MHERNQAPAATVREAYLAGRMPKKLYHGSPSSPSAGLITAGK